MNEAQEKLAEERDASVKELIDAYEGRQKTFQAIIDAESAAGAAILTAAREAFTTATEEAEAHFAKAKDALAMNLKDHESLQAHCALITDSYVGKIAQAALIEPQ